MECLHDIWRASLMVGSIFGCALTAFLLAVHEKSPLQCIYRLAVPSAAQAQYDPARQLDRQAMSEALGKILHVFPAVFCGLHATIFAVIAVCKEDDGSVLSGPYYLKWIVYSNAIVLTMTFVVEALILGVGIGCALCGRPLELPVGMHLALILLWKKSSNTNNLNGPTSPSVATK